MSQRLEQTDEELLARLRNGDEQAFVSLYRRRHASIFRFALNMSGSAVQAEDITQEVFLALLRHDLGFDSTRGTLSGYLFGIARKLVLRHLERTRPDVAIEPDGEENAPYELAVSHDPLADMSHRETIEALRRAVVTLPRRYREVVVLCDLEEIDYAAAAEALGCPIGTVRSRLHRARALLLDKLNQERRPRPGMQSLNPARCEI